MSDDGARGGLARPAAGLGPAASARAATELMGPEGVRSNGHPNIFPNLWITLCGLQMCLRLPRGPSRDRALVVHHRAEGRATRS